MKYFKVVVLLGHFGSGNSHAVALYIKANDDYSAMMKAKSVPGVKHDRMPLSVEEITEQQFKDGRELDEYGNIMANNKKV